MWATSDRVRPWIGENVKCKADIQNSLHNQRSTNDKLIKVSNLAYNTVGLRGWESEKKLPAQNAKKLWKYDVQVFRKYKFWNILLGALRDFLKIKYFLIFNMIVNEIGFSMACYRSFRLKGDAYDSFYSFCLFSR